MRLATPTLEQSRAVLSASSSLLDAIPTTDVTPGDVRKMMLYLRKARDKATAIRDRSPGGSYMEGVLTRTIDGITLELSQLEYLLAQKPVDASATGSSSRRMRPAI
ncbi:hypothetical protein [Roseibium sp. Sym1]|uniref:hypothetical protein n=1 Tax=Roseibium sp. Sym1 TaxID=3016006 RepID=UPI0022B4C4D3|nr:hypothetical protein [Roseibium sp. Sym1]